MINCNISCATPFDIFSGYESGNISMIDFRTMTEESCYNLGTNLIQFEVHKHLPYCVGLSNELVTFTNENGIINTEIINLNINIKPNSFCLHPNENICALRFSNIIQCNSISNISVY